MHGGAPDQVELGVRREVERREAFAAALGSALVAFLSAHAVVGAAPLT